MGWFRSGPREVRLQDSDVTVRAREAPWSLWADAFGRLAIRAVQILLVVAIAVGAIWLIRQVTVVTIPFVLALIFASAVAPVMLWLRRRGVPAILATIITLLAILIVLGLLGWLIVWAVRDQWNDLAQQATQGFQDFMAWVSTLPFAPSSAQIDEWIQQAIAWGTDFVTSSQFGSGAVAGVSAVATFIAGMVLLVVILFYFLKDGPRMWEFVLRPFRGQPYERAQRIGRKTVGVLGSYVRGTAAVAFVDALGIGIGLWILQVPLALPLAVLVFLLAFIPIVGATLAGILAALVALVANGWFNALLVVGIVVLVNQLEGNFLQPVLMGRSMKLHSFVVLVALAVGTAVGGILGTLLAVPITAVAWGIVQVWEGEDRPARWARAKAAELREARQPTVE